MGAEKGRNGGRGAPRVKEKEAYGVWERRGGRERGCRVLLVQDKRVQVCSSVEEWSEGSWYRESERSGVPVPGNGSSGGPDTGGPTHSLPPPSTGSPPDPALEPRRCSAPAPPPSPGPRLTLLSANGRPRLQ